MRRPERIKAVLWLDPSHCCFQVHGVMVFCPVSGHFAPLTRPDRLEIAVTSSVQLGEYIECGFFGCYAGGKRYESLSA